LPNCAQWFKYGIEVKCQIKVLELIFDKKLSWYTQAMTVIEKAIKIKQGLQLKKKKKK